jgi:uncharacterized damage-inducible protein DinB
MNAFEPFAHWIAVRRGLVNALDRLADEHLAFSPGRELWTLGTVARHIANAEDGWFRYVVTAELDEWPVFTPEAYPTVEAIQGLLAEVHERTIAYLSDRGVEDLERSVTAPWGHDFTLRWVTWHVLEHEIHHRGEISLMMGLLGMEGIDV